MNSQSPAPANKNSRPEFTRKELTVNHDKRFSDVLHLNNNNNDKILYTYYTIHTIQDEDIDRLANARGVQQSFYCSRELKHIFTEAVLLSDPTSNVSDVFRRFMVNFIKDFKKREDKPQIKITQFFINKPEVVNIAEKVTSVASKSEPLPDFSKMTLEELQKRYDKAVAPQDYARRMTLAFELKKRGVIV
jgi:hypothetical protein